LAGDTMQLQKEYGKTTLDQFRDVVRDLPESWGILPAAGSTSDMR